MNFQTQKEKVLQNKKNCIVIFLIVMVLFTIASCAGGKNKVIKTAKSLAFFTDTYQSQYLLGDVADTALDYVNWTAQKIDGEWYVTLSGKLANTDNLPTEARQMISLYKSWGLDVTKVTYSFDFLIQGNYGQIYSGGVSYDGEYSESDVSDVNSNLRLLYIIYDGTINN